MKQCSRCGEDKDDSEFYRKQSGSLKLPCKACHTVRSREWRIANREESRARKKRIYHNNSAKIIAYMKQWLIDHPEAHEKHKAQDRAREQDKDYHAAASYLNTHGFKMRHIPSELFDLKKAELIANREIKKHKEGL